MHKDDLPRNEAGQLVYNAVTRKGIFPLLYETFLGVTVCARCARHRDDTAGSQPRLSIAFVQINMSSKVEFCADCGRKIENAMDIIRKWEKDTGLDWLEYVEVW